MSADGECKLPYVNKEVRKRMTQSGLLTLYSDIQAEPVNWIWYPYIASGKITLLQGDPGEGKSTMIMNLIAELSKGGTLPDGTEIGRPRRVIYQCSENGVADTIKPRLEKCGADCRNIAFLNEEVHSGLTLDDERIRQAIIEFHPKLVVIDPVQAYLGNDSDLMMAARARKLMHRIGMWAGVFDCAVILIGHLNKREGGKELYHGMGTIDIVAAARSVLQVERSESGANIRIVRQIKNSLAPNGAEICFDISSEVGFRWLPSNYNRTEYPVHEQTEALTKQEQAAYLMKQLLTEGDMKAKDVLQAMSEHGIGERTVQSTKAALGITSYRKMRQWYWHLEQPAPIEED